MKYEYETLQGVPIIGVCSHVSVRYTSDGVGVLIFDESNTFEFVEVVSFLTPPDSEIIQTHKFVCDRFTIDNSSLST